jgi:signal transduction histidine kinase
LIIEAIFLILLPVNRGSTIAIWVFFFPLWSLLGMVVSGLIYGITGEGGKIQEQTKKQIVESRAAAGSALESIRKIQKIFTETVHGRIQSKFTAASLLLETTAKQHDGQEIPSDLTKQMTNQLEQLLIEARKDLTKLSEWTETTPETFEEILNSAQKNWTQLVEIDFNIDDLSKQIANENTWLRSAFEDILNETITNAVRHGKANKIKIIAKIDKENKIFNISIVNNGSVQEENSERTGIGFLNLRELGIEIQQFSSDKGHETKIEVPLYFEKNPDLLSV